MRIVVLDGFTLNPGDLSWAELESLGSCQIYDRTPASEVVSRAAEADIILTNKTVVSRDHIPRLYKLSYIGVLATGYNNVDIAAARERAIMVTNVPAYGTQSVAQMTFALLLELTHRVAHHSKTVREGRWTHSLDFCYWDYPLIELDGLTMGVVGYGRIGRAVGNLALAFGMKLLAHEPWPPTPTPSSIEFVGLDDLFRRSDVVSLHCPLTNDTQHLANARRLALMKPTAFLLNTSRGPLVDESALAEALNAGRLAGAGLDVLPVEPPPAGNPLFEARNCLITPHIAWATQAARTRLMRIAVANIRAFLSGQPQNVVNYRLVDSRWL
jgi:glycerate dehydrogenase